MLQLRHVLPSSFAAPVMGLALLGGSLGGCASLNDLSYEHTQKQRATDAWQCFAAENCDQSFSKDYKLGYKAGYYDVLTGGTGCPPVVAPRRYWDPSNVLKYCDERRMEWYRGFQDGAACAQNQPDTHYVKLFTPPCNTCEPPVPSGSGTMLPPPIDVYGPASYPASDETLDDDTADVDTDDLEGDDTEDDDIPAPPEEDKADADTDDSDDETMDSADEEADARLKRLTEEARRLREEKAKDEYFPKPKQAPLPELDEAAPSIEAPPVKAPSNETVKAPAAAPKANLPTADVEARPTPFRPSASKGKTANGKPATGFASLFTESDADVVTASEAEAFDAMFNAPAANIVEPVAIEVLADVKPATIAVDVIEPADVVEPTATEVLANVEPATANVGVAEPAATVEPVAAPNAEVTPAVTPAVESVEPLFGPVMPVNHAVEEDAEPAVRTSSGPRSSGPAVRPLFSAKLGQPFGGAVKPEDAVDSVPRSTGKIEPTVTAAR